MKKVIILYDSLYGNTKKVAMSLSRGIEEGGVFVDTNHIKDFKINQLKNYDVIGIGGPTHFHGASKPIKSFLNKIKDLNMENKQGFAFETKTDCRLAGSAAKRIMRYLKKMKCEIINTIITGIVIDKEGPLQENTLNTMESLGLRLSNKINNSKEGETIENRF